MANRRSGKIANRRTSPWRLASARDYSASIAAKIGSTPLDANETIGIAATAAVAKIDRAWYLNDQPWALVRPLLGVRAGGKPQPSPGLPIPRLSVAY